MGDTSNLRRLGTVMTLIGFLAGLGLGSGARAAIITFTGRPEGPLTAFQEAGFIVGPVPGEYIPAILPEGNPSPAMGNYEGGVFTEARMRPTCGGFFRFVQVDYASPTNPQSFVEVAGYLGATLIYQQTLTGSGGTWASTSNAWVTDLRFYFIKGDGAAVWVDNIVVTVEDCDGNGVADACELGANDCNGNGTLDACEPTYQDCNTNGTLDECDLFAGASQDCNLNNTPDECEPDCNANNTLDECDIAYGTSTDCDLNSTPDECDPDCNANEVADQCDFTILGSYALPEPGFVFIPPQNSVGVAAVITVPGGGFVTDVNVETLILQQSQGDLVVTLSHGGTTRTLINRPGSCATPGGYAEAAFGSGFNWLVLDDSAPVDIDCYNGSESSGINNYVGPARPSQPLTAFNGLDAGGPWTLTFIDSPGGLHPGAGFVFLRLNVQRTYHPPTGQSLSPNLDVPNGDPTGVTSIMTVPDGGVVTDVDVALHIRCFVQGDLVATLAHGGVTRTLINRPGVACHGNFGYGVSDFGSAGNPLILDDAAAIGIDCYAGGGGSGITDYAGPAQPTQALSAFRGLDPAGPWVLTVIEPPGGVPPVVPSTLVTWGLNLHTRSADCNANGTPDECDGGCVPAATLTGAVSRKANAAGPGVFCDLPLLPGPASEPRNGGITELRAAFDVPPGAPGPNPITIEQATCAAPSFAPYVGASTPLAVVTGNTLVLTFSPPLENARTYRIHLGSTLTSIAGQYVQVRGLVGDVNNNGLVNANDRSVAVGVWTAPGSFSCGTDVNSSGATNGNDRSIIVGAWTGLQNCAP